MGVAEVAELPSSAHRQHGRTLIGHSLHGLAIRSERVVSGLTRVTPGITARDETLEALRAR